MNVIYEKIQSLKDNEKFSKIIMIIGIIGICLIFVSSLGQSNKSKVNSYEKEYESKYIKTMERKLEDLISNTQGAGKTQVLITLESGEEYVYAKEERQSRDLSEDVVSLENKRLQKSDNIQSNYILVDINGNKTALVQKKLEPVIKGVVVICEGGDKTIIKGQVTEIVTTALDLPSTKVCVIKKSSGQ